MYPALAEQRNLKFSCGEKFHISSPSPLNIALVFITEVQGLILPLRDIFLFLYKQPYYLIFLILVSPTKLWFLFSASWDLTSQQLPLTIITMSASEIVCVAWKFAFFFIWKCGTFWVSGGHLHEGRLRLLLARLLWKLWASWSLGQPHPSWVGVNPSAVGWDLGHAERCALCIFLP